MKKFIFLMLMVATVATLSSFTPTIAEKNESSFTGCTGWSQTVQGSGVYHRICVDCLQCWPYEQYGVYVNGVMVVIEEPW